MSEEARKGPGSLEAGITGSCESPNGCGCWELNSSPLQSRLFVCLLVLFSRQVFFVSLAFLELSL